MSGPTASPAELESACLELDSYTVRVGEPVGPRGEGFLPGDQLRVYLSSSPSVSLAEAQADTQGRFAIAEVKLPGPDDGDRTVVVQGETSGVRVQRTFSVVGYSPWVVLDRYAVKPGETIGFSGYDLLRRVVQVVGDHHGVDAGPGLPAHQPDGVHAGR